MIDHPSGLPDPRPPWWAWLYGAVVLLMVAASLYTVCVSMWRGPFRDMWEALPFIEKALAGQAGWEDYWEQYGFSHRPWISRWLWVADCRWFACSNQLLLAVSIMCQGLIGLAAWRILRREEGVPAPVRAVVGPGILLCLFSSTQVFNFLHTFDVQWFVTAAGVMWSVERVLAGRERHHNGLLLQAWLCIFIGSLNNFSALVMWPVQAIFLLRLGYRPVQVATYTAGTLAYLLVYFHGLPTGTGNLLGQLAGQPLTAWLGFAAMIVYVFPVWYLSNPLSFQFAPEGPLQVPWPWTWLGPALATGLLLLLAVRGWTGLSGRWRPGGLGWAGLMLGLYGYGVAVVTSLGRGFFWDNVYALRYQNIVLLFWIGVLLLLVASPSRRMAGAVLGAVLLMVVVGAHQGWSHNHLIKMGNRTRDAHLALAVGLERELPVIQATVSRSHLHEGTTYTLEREAAFLRQIGGGPYGDPGWKVPAFETLSGVPACAEQVSTVDVRGQQGGYARLAVDFAQSVDFGLLAWFDADRNRPGLLLPVVSDSFTRRLAESLAGADRFAGFAQTLPVQAPAHVYARAGADWCRLVVP